MALTNPENSVEKGRSPSYRPVGLTHELRLKKARVRVPGYVPARDQAAEIDELEGSYIELQVGRNLEFDKITCDMLNSPNNALLAPDDKNLHYPDLCRGIRAVNAEGYALIYNFLVDQSMGFQGHYKRDIYDLVKLTFVEPFKIKVPKFKNADAWDDAIKEIKPDNYKGAFKYISVAPTAMYDGRILKSGFQSIRDEDGAGGAFEIELINPENAIRSSKPEFVKKYTTQSDDNNTITFYSTGNELILDGTISRKGVRVILDGSSDLSKYILGMLTADSISQKGEKIWEVLRKFFALQPVDLTDGQRNSVIQEMLQGDSHGSSIRPVNLLKNPIFRAAKVVSKLEHGDELEHLRLEQKNDSGVFREYDNTALLDTAHKMGIPIVLEGIDLLKVNPDNVARRPGPMKFDYKIGSLQDLMFYSLNHYNDQGASISEWGWNSNEAYPGGSFEAISLAPDWHDPSVNDILDVFASSEEGEIELPSTLNNLISSNVVNFIGFTGNMNIENDARNWRIDQSGIDSGRYVHLCFLNKEDAKKFWELNRNVMGLSVIYFADSTRDPSKTKNFKLNEWKEEKKKKKG